MFMFTDTAGGYTEVCVRSSKLAQPYTQDGWTYLQSELYLSNVDLNKQTRRPGGDLFPDSKLEPENFLMIGEKTSSIPGTPSDSGGRGGRGRQTELERPPPASAALQAWATGQPSERGKGGASGLSCLPSCNRREEHCVRCSATFPPGTLARQAIRGHAPLCEVGVKCLVWPQG